jgi:hypothetical protein
MTHYIFICEQGSYKGGDRYQTAQMDYCAKFINDCTNRCIKKR